MRAVAGPPAAGTTAMWPGAYHMSLASPPATNAMARPSGLNTGCEAGKGSLATGRGVCPARGATTKMSVLRLASASGVRLLEKAIHCESGDQAGSASS